MYEIKKIKTDHKKRTNTKEWEKGLLSAMSVIEMMKKKKKKKNIT